MHTVKIYSKELRNYENKYQQLKNETNEICAKAASLLGGEINEQKK